MIFFYSNIFYFNPTHHIYDKLIIFLVHNSIIKISISTDISILRFYGYIEDISMNIFT